MKVVVVSFLLLMVSSDLWARGQVYYVQGAYGLGEATVGSGMETYGFQGAAVRLGYTPLVWGQTFLLRIGGDFEASQWTNSHTEQQWVSGSEGQETLHLYTVNPTLGVSYAVARHWYMGVDVRGSYGRGVFTQTGATPGSQYYGQVAGYGAVLNFGRGKIGRIRNWLLEFRLEGSALQLSQGSATSFADVEDVGFSALTIGLGLARRTR